MVPCLLSGTGGLLCGVHLPLATDARPTSRDWLSLIGDVYLFSPSKVERSLSPVQGVLAAARRITSTSLRRVIALGLGILARAYNLDGSVSLTFCSTEISTDWSRRTSPSSAGSTSLASLYALRASIRAVLY